MLLNLKLEETVQTRPHVLILGGGISGMATALSLEKQGISFSVFEKFGNHQIVGNGAGLSMVQRVLEILQEIGCDKKLIDSKVNMASKMILEYYEGTVVRTEENTTKLSAAWTNLYEILDDSLKEEYIHYGKRIVKVERLENGQIQLTDQNGCKYLGDVLVVGDGARSKVRELLTGSETMKVLNYTGHLNLRGLIQITDCEKGKKFEEELLKYYPDAYDTIRLEFGDNFHTGWQMLPNKKVSWWSYVNSEDPLIWPNLTAIGKFLTKDMVDTCLSKMEGQVSKGLQFLFDNTDNFMLNVITDADIDKWVYGNIVLVGDAAHPMTPNCGLAACMAIVDGYTLSHHLAKHLDNMEHGLKSYEKARLETVRKFVKLDHEAGQERNRFKDYKNDPSKFDEYYQKAHELFVSKENIHCG